MLTLISLKRVWFRGDEGQRYLRVADLPRGGEEAINRWFDDNEFGYSSEKQDINLRRWEQEQFEEYAGDRDWEED